MYKRFKLTIDVHPSTFYVMALFIRAEVYSVKSRQWADLCAKCGIRGGVEFAYDTGGNRYAVKKGKEEVILTKAV